MESTEPRSPAGIERHSRNVSNSKTQPVRTHLHEGEFDPLADAPPLPERPIEKKVPSPNPRPEVFPAQSLKDFSHILRTENFHALTSHGVPPPFRDPDLSQLGANPSISTLLDGGYFRSAAVEASTALITNPPPPQDMIFHLLYVRLTCLTLLGQVAQAAQESRCLQDISSPFYLSSISPRQNILPWELRVLVTRLQSISIGDPRKAVTGYYDLARDAREAILAASSQDEKSLWHVRLFDLGIRVANALIETGDLIAAARHLETLDIDAAPRENRQVIHGRLGLVYLRIGNLAKARQIITADDVAHNSLSTDFADILRPLLSVAEGEYPDAATQLENAENASVNEQSLSNTNLAVTLLYTGDLKKARGILEKQLERGMRFSSLLFNLATVFELCTEKARALKVQLAENVANSHDPLGFERSVVDFKL